MESNSGIRYFSAFSATELSTPFLVTVIPSSSSPEASVMVSAGLLVLSVFAESVNLLTRRAYSSGSVCGSTILTLSVSSVDIAANAGQARLIVSTAARSRDIKRLAVFVDIYVHFPIYLTMLSFIITSAPTIAATIVTNISVPTPSVGAKRRTTTPTTMGNIEIFQCFLK